ncbi:unnamed protein product [Eruca vesicaria subsp. sativa]|uniref:Uncharacterized protein n=1 Tax=Eruca vesicaria subsp. sativa TaxID=29727 RepID=A0ABC8JQX1_ERUVS|nr:unnamed protein product [Eruca vesicaria subsp. sativa]
MSANLHLVIMVPIFLTVSQSSVAMARPKIPAGRDPCSVSDFKVLLKISREGSKECCEDSRLVTQTMMVRSIRR